MNFLHATRPQEIAFHTGTVDIYWYGVFIALAIVTGFVITYNYSKKKQMSTEHVFNLLFLIVVFGVIGGRIGHIIGDLGYYSDNPSELYKIWHGGLAIHGVLLASIFVVYVYSRIQRLSFWLLTDSIVFSLPLMQAIGRWGNYFNQELYGLPTDVSWGIPIEAGRRVAAYATEQYFHPLFLYESMLMLLVFICLVIIVPSVKLKTGALTLLYFLIFPVIRFSLDFFRIEMLSIGPLLLTQWISILLFVTAAFLLIRLYRPSSPKSNGKENKQANTRKLDDCPCKSRKFVSIDDAIDIIMYMSMVVKCCFNILKEDSRIPFFKKDIK